MTGFQIVDELPPAVKVKKEYSNGGNDIQALIRFLIANPGKWVEVGRFPMYTDAGNHNAAPYTKGNRIRRFGIQIEMRRDGDDKVLFARLVPGAAA